VSSRRTSLSYRLVANTRTFTIQAYGIPVWVSRLTDDKRRSSAPQSSIAATKRGADALVRAGPPGPALSVFEQADQGVGRGPGGPPHEIVAGCGGLRLL
jgi:hypothetical protein